MDNHQARHTALLRAAAHIDADLEGGGYLQECDTDADAKRLAHALRTVRDELLRRAAYAAEMQASKNPA